MAWEPISTAEPGRNADPQAPPQTRGIRVCISTRRPRGSVCTLECEKFYSSLALYTLLLYCACFLPTRLQAPRGQAFVPCNPYQVPKLRIADVLIDNEQMKTPKAVRVGIMQSRIRGGVCQGQVSSLRQETWPWVFDSRVPRTELPGRGRENQEVRWFIFSSSGTG